MDMSETDVDCGGDDCPRCNVGLTCTENDDCSSFTCVSSVCAEPPTPVPMPVPTAVPMTMSTIAPTKRVITGAPSSAAPTTTSGPEIDVVATGEEASDQEATSSSAAASSPVLLLGVVGAVGVIGAIVAAVACNRAAKRQAKENVFEVPSHAVVTVPADEEARLRGGEGSTYDPPTTAPLPAAARGLPVSLAPAVTTAVVLEVATAVDLRDTTEC